MVSLLALAGIPFFSAGPIWRSTAILFSIAGVLVLSLCLFLLPVFVYCLNDLTALKEIIQRSKYEKSLS